MASVGPCKLPGRSFTFWSRCCRAGLDPSGKLLLHAATLFLGAWLHAAPASAQVMASGKSLTVTTANAVATFNGPDLVGFVNSLTSEQYLKKPSNGDLAAVDAMSN